MSTQKRPGEPVSDPARIDDAVLALLWLTSVTERRAHFKETWAWKGHDWDALGRLHEKGFISNPVGKAKRVSNSSNKDTVVLLSLSVVVFVFVVSVLMLQVNLLLYLIAQPPISFLDIHLDVL